MRENRTYGLMRGRAYPERDAPPYSTSKSGGVETMAMPQRDDSPTPRLRRTGTIEAIKRRAAEKKDAEEKKKAEVRARAAYRRK